ncbi:microtubule-associated tumor suppressor 1-like isoform X2 [Solea solea]|uniref:microtubule-associated tumor suppressor 1-like isoform X2 n=1 Tax=Solea solea TaxID=90069 RepID=UPI00272ADE76|nr:microtubule-associated tumor suppressor 1-like isoform X2 [Solea solea]
MSLSEARESFQVRDKGGSYMGLPLHTAGDVNGNAFSVSSSSPSSSSSFYLGESSPELLRSLSSLSGGQTDNPLDYDMFEVTLTTTVLSKETDVVISKWLPKEDGEANDCEDASEGKIQMVKEQSESNDNSVSIYLDASSGDYCQDDWNDNDNLTVAQSLSTNSCSCGNNDHLSSGSGRRHDSSTQDSDATEVPVDDDDDDDDDEEEAALFQSVSSELGAQRSSSAMIPCGCAAVMEGTGTVMAAELLLERSEVSCPLDLPMDNKSDSCTSEIPNEKIQILSVLSQDSKELASPEESEKRAVASKPTRPSTSQPGRAVNTKPTTAPPTTTTQKSTTSAGIKLSSMETKRVSKPDLKNVKAKVGSRPTTTPAKAPNQIKSAPATGKKVVSRKEEVQTGDGVKSQRSSADPSKVAVVQKPIRGRMSNLKTTATDCIVPEKESAAVSPLGCEVFEEGPVDTYRKAAQEVPDKHCAAESVEIHTGVDAGVKDPVEGTVEVVMSEVASVEKPKSHNRKVSSKLGSSARQQGKSPRVDKACGAAAPPGSGTGPPGQGSLGLKQTQNESSMLGEVGQSAGAGSPTRVRQTQSQSIPKPRTTTERAAPGLTSSIFKPVPANQQSAAVSAGRPAAPTASKLPVKGLSATLSVPLVGRTDNNGATSKASAAPAGIRPEERASRGMCPVGSQNVANPPGSSTTAAASEAVIGTNSAAPKAPLMRTRALSLQARTTATGLKAPTASNHNTSKSTAVSQTAVKAAPSAHQASNKQTSQYPLQRSGSARLSRLNSTVDKNKPREAPARSTNNTNTSSSSTSSSSTSQVTAAAAATGGGTSLNRLQPQPDLVLDVPVAEVTNPGSCTTGTSGLGFKGRTGSRSSPKTGSRLQNAFKPGVARAATTDGIAVTAKQNQSKEQAEKKNQAITQLKRLLTQGNKRVEALATVIQYLFSEREESLKQKKELSLELANLRDELVVSTQSCERLKKERDEVRVSREEALKSLEEQHKEELVQLEDRLRSFYQTEWDKVHQMYQEEADKCRMLMEQQVEELRSQHEAEKKNHEVSHSQKMESVKQQYENSIQVQDKVHLAGNKELKRIQQTDVENLQTTLAETETSLSEKITELSAEKEALSERLQAEEERRRRILTDKNLKDSHTVYLEQELESLKVVLEIKNNQLHQKEKKLMEMDKLVETNVKLEECLTKVQQENEDYKARMDKHAALSRQLSSEQAKLQQTLQKESKVNKRLSMENEELLWKLHNGDLLASPRRLSPTSPFNSPRNSASFPTAAPLSPR